MAWLVGIALAAVGAVIGWFVPRDTMPAFDVLSAMVLLVVATLVLVLLGVISRRRN